MLIIEYPSSFIALSYVEIRESNGLLFYIAKEGKKFNLPKGKYLLQGVIDEVPFSRIEKTFEIANSYMNLPKDFKLTFIDNYPNKCSIEPETGRVFADSSFKNSPKFVFAFVLYHEEGHFKYRGSGFLSEKQCDAYAREKMLDDGYNPSQIDLAAKVTLSNSPSSCIRKNLSFEALRKK